MVSAGKGGPASDLLELFLPNNVSARERFKELVKDVVAARQEFEDAIKTGMEGDEVTMTLKVPRLGGNDP